MRTSGGRRALARARELQDAVNARVGRFWATSDAEDLLDPAGIRDAEALLAASPAPGAFRAVGLLRYARHFVLPEERERPGELQQAQVLLDQARAGDVPALLRRLGEAAAQPVRYRPGKFAVFSFADSPLHDVDNVIAGTRHRLYVLPAGDPEAWPARMALAEAQRLRYLRTGHVADLDVAIATVREARATVPAGHVAGPAGVAAILGELLTLRFNASTYAEAAIRDLNGAICAFRDALGAAQPDDRVYYSMHQGNVGKALLTRYLVLRQDDDLDAATGLLQASLDGTDELARALRLHRLGEAYFARYSRSRDLAELDRALQLGRSAVDATDPATEDYAERILDIAPCYLVRYTRTGDKSDLDDAARIARRIRHGYPSGHPSRAQADQVLAQVRALRHAR